MKLLRAFTWFLLLAALGCLFAGFSALAMLSWSLFFLGLYGMDLLRALRVSVVNPDLKRAVRKGNRAVSSATPARPTSLAARNAPGTRASLLTLNPNLFKN